MGIAEARVETTRASRYLVQLCRHASLMGRHGPPHAGMDQGERPGRVDAEWSDEAGVITVVPWGRCTLRALPDALVVRVQAAEPEHRQRIQELIERNLSRFGRRDQLTVSWQDLAADTEEPAAPVSGPRGHRRAITLAASGVLGVGLMVAMHLGLGGALAATSWLGWSVAGLAIVPVVLVAAHAAVPLAVVRFRRRASR